MQSLQIRHGSHAALNIAGSGQRLLRDHGVVTVLCSAVQLSQEPKIIIQFFCPNDHIISRVFHKICTQPPHDAPTTCTGYGLRIFLSMSVVLTKQNHRGYGSHESVRKIVQPPPASTLRPQDKRATGRIQTHRTSNVN